MLTQTGERLSSKVYAKIMVEHLHRYAFATYYTQGKRVLDIASGEGYGTNLLAKNADFVYGVDVSKDAVAHANEQYKAPNIKFLEGDVTHIPLNDNEVDVVVSFETIEHLREHDEMIMECKRVMKDDGTLIISTPDKKFYSDITGYKNPFHVKELYCNEFMALISKYFSNIVLYRQGIAKGGIIYSSDVSSNGFKIYNGHYSEINCDQNIHLPEYLIIVASNKDFKTNTNSLFESNAVNAELQNEITKYKKMYDTIYFSTTYRVGRILLSPFQFVRSFLKSK